MTVPRTRPCASCPYRRDVPSGIWAESEYDKLPGYDRDTGYQPSGMFFCHSDAEKVCAGWAGCHDMVHALAVRLARAMRWVSDSDLDAILSYETTVPLFGSGREAADHGKRDLLNPGEKARRKAAGLERIVRRRA